MTLTVIELRASTPSWIWDGSPATATPRVFAFSCADPMIGTCHALQGSWWSPASSMVRLMHLMSDALLK